MIANNVHKFVSLMIVIWVESNILFYIERFEKILYSKFDNFLYQKLHYQILVVLFFIKSCLEL